MSGQGDWDKKQIENDLRRIGAIGQDGEDICVNVGERIVCDFTRFEDQIRPDSISIDGKNLEFNLHFPVRGVGELEEIDQGSDLLGLCSGESDMYIRTDEHPDENLGSGHFYCQTVPMDKYDDFIERLEISGHIQESIQSHRGDISC